MEGWKQLSFKENNMNIDRARSFCENHIVEKFGDIGIQLLSNGSLLQRR